MGFGRVKDNSWNSFLSCNVPLVLIDLNDWKKNRQPRGSHVIEYRVEMKRQAALQEEQWQ